jgi:hypothetical protein
MIDGCFDGQALRALLAASVRGRASSGKHSKICVSTACSPKGPRKASTMASSTTAVLSKAASKDEFFFQASMISRPVAVPKSDKLPMARRALAVGGTVHAAYIDSLALGSAEIPRIGA